MSPGVTAREQDFSVFASRIGITRLGLIGKTQKGPAFKAIKVSSTDEYLLRFGSTSPNFPLSYVANSFLGQANDLTISRVLGAGGFSNSPAWLITANDVLNYAGSITVSGATFTAPIGLGASAYTMTFAELAMASGTSSASTYVAGSGAITINYSGCTMYMIQTAMTINSNWISYGVTVTGGDNISLIVDSAVTFNTVVESMPKYSGATLAILRSKKDDSGNAFFDQESDVIIGASATVNALGDFVLSATTGPLSSGYTNGLTVSLDETKGNYIVKALGKNPKETVDTIDLYVEEIYPHFIREAVARGEITKLNATLIFKDDTDVHDAYTNYGDDYKHSITPWVVSRVVGGKVNKLFKFHTISDGDASAQEIKISIANIDVNNYTFDVIVRRFEDTDATSFSTSLETFSNVTLDDTQPNFIGKYIGTLDGQYTIKSTFVKVEMAVRYPENSVPAGFEGYNLRGIAGSSAATPDIYYKTTYLSGESAYKTYLGISELGYTSLTQSLVTSKFSVKSIESDLFVYHGSATSGMTATKGFHMENIADANSFVSGNKISLTAYTKQGTSITDKSQLKFTLVPAGGFDGFNKYKTFENPCDEFAVGETTNVQQFNLAVDVLANPEEVDVNLIATPGIDFETNPDIIRYALEMAENRADSLYIIDAPRITTTDDLGNQTKGTPEEVVSLLESTGIDSNYAATYWPWIQIVDTASGKYTYQSPTLFVVKALALTDNVSAPWFAPAGFNRGVAGKNIIQTDVKLSKGKRDTLYGGRINPIASFVQQGIVILGQKTLQNRQSALDRINIRRLLLQVRRLVAAASLTLLFEQNDQTLRDQFLAKVEPILLGIQNQRGLFAFKCVADSSNNTNETIDRNMLVGKIQLKPTPSCEFIDLTYEILPSGANFSDF